MNKLFDFAKTLKVLYVEDNEEARESTVALLSNIFNNIETGVDGKDGLEKFKKQKFDLVITDILMPRMNGLEMIEEIKKIDKNIPIIIISAYNGNDYLLKSIKLGVRGLVPMQIEYLSYVGALQFLKLFYSMASKIDAKFTFLGVVPTLYNKSLKEHNEIIQKLEEKLAKNRVLPSIRKDFKLSQSFIQGKPICYFDNRCRGAKDYNLLSDVIIDKIF